MSIDVSGLLSYQPANVVTLLTALNRFRAAVDGSDTGCGKTFVAMAVARELNTKPLIVCPKAVMASWHRVAAHLGGECFTVNYEKLKFKNEWGNLIDPPGLAETKELVKGIELCVKQANLAPGEALKLEQRLAPHKKKLMLLKARRRFVWNQEEIGLLIFDEAHRCKGQNSLNAKMMIAARRQNIPTLALSATLTENPLDMRASGYLLGLHAGTDFWQWAERYGCVPGDWGGLQFIGGSGTLKRLHSQIYPDRGVRTTREALGDAFPNAQITAELYDLEHGGRINELYAEMNHSLEKLRGLAAEDKDLEHPLTQLLRARQKIELLKVPVFVDLARDALEEGMSPAIFVNFDETLTQIAVKLETECVIRGGQGADERQANIDAFQTNRSRVIVANQKAGGVGVSLHDLDGKHPRLALISPTYSAIDLIQTLGRVWRQGAKSKAIQRVVLAAGTVEEKIQKRLHRKLANISLLNDGDLIDLFS